MTQIQNKIQSRIRFIIPDHGKPFILRYNNSFITITMSNNTTYPVDQNAVNCWNKLHNFTEVDPQEAVLMPEFERLI